MSEQCRVCLGTSSTVYFDMETTTFGDITYMEFFLQCTQLKNADVNILPVLICNYCSQDLEMVYDFVNGARQADAILRETAAKPLEMAAIKNEVNEDEQSSHEPQEDEMLVESLELTDEVALNNDEDENVEYVIEEFLEDDMEYENFNALDESMMELDTDAYSLDKMQYDTLQDDSSDTQSELIHLNIKVGQNNEDWEEEEEVAYDIRLASYSDEEFGETVIKTVRQATKWKCLICRRELRADISYEGHMNLHKKARPYKCVQCQNTFRCKNTLQHHIDVHHQSEELTADYICLICEATFEQQHELAEHKCPEENSLQTCKECNKDFDSNTELEQHMQLVHSNATHLKCPHCATLAPLERSTLAEHFRVQHEKEFEKHFQADMEQFIVAEPKAAKIENSHWQCDICRCILNTEEELQQHRSTHLNERPHECQYCAKCFSAASNLRQHIRSTHPLEYEQNLQENCDMVVECETCKKQLLRRNLERHRAMHEKKQREAAQEPLKFLCSFCPRECKNQKALHQHEKLHQGESPDVIYVCADCDRQYNTEHLLRQHRKQAHKKRDNICTICGNAFKLKNQLVNHMKLHLEKNIQCPYCDKKYARHFDLNVHMRTHTGELPYACHLCERRFAIKVRLTYHLQKHYGVKHPCKECGAEFNSKQKLKAHSYKHSGMPYRCDACDNHGFANRDVFKRHLLRVHNATMTNEALLEMFQRNTGKTTRIRTIDEINDELSAAETQIDMAEHFLINTDEDFDLDLVETIVPA